MSEHKPSMKSKELSVDLWDRIVLRNKSGEGYRKISAALKDPMSTVASVNGRSSEPPGLFLELAGHLNWAIGEKALSQGGDQEPGGHSVRASAFLCGERTTISAAIHQSGLYGRLARGKPLLSKRHMEARLEFAKMHLKDSPTLRNKIIWSDETKIELLVWMPGVMFRGSQAPFITRPIPSLQWSMVVAASCCGDVFSSKNWETSHDRGKGECSNVQRHPGWKPAPERSWPQTGATVHLSAGQQP